MIGMDYKGFGLSEGTRGHITDRNDFYDNAYQFLVKGRKFYKELYPEAEIPFLTIGYSQGCAASLGVARYMHEHGDVPLAGQLMVVPNFRIQMDHWTEEFKATLAEKIKDPSQHSEFPAKPLKDWSFLLPYVQDELQFKGPHYAITISIIKEVSDEDREYMKLIQHPIHLSKADGDNILDNSEIDRFFSVIKTPEDKKVMLSYDSDHYILSDGWLYEEVISKQVEWLETILPKASA